MCMITDSKSLVLQVGYCAMAQKQTETLALPLY